MGATVMKVLHVAAVQLDCQPCMREANLTRATPLVEAAAGQGAALVLLPELVPGGYILTERIWDGAEPVDGPSVRWLCDTARRLGIMVGMSLLEAEGEHFYNSFVLAGPAGVLGRVRKDPAASVEAYFYAAGSGSHVIETEIGRIGVGICYENLLYDHLVALHRQSVDLVLQPTSAATPTLTFPFRRRDAEAFDCLVGTGPHHYAKALGVPVVMANKCGRFQSELPGGFPAQDTTFPGLSCIVDGDGVVKASLAGKEGVIVAPVMLDPARKTAALPAGRGRWCGSMPWYAWVWPLSQWMGERAYARNPRRAARARAVAVRE